MNSLPRLINNQSEFYTGCPVNYSEIISDSFHLLFMNSAKFWKICQTLHSVPGNF